MLAILGLALSAGTWIWYLALIPIERVPKRPTVHVGFMAVALVLGVAGSFSGGWAVAVGVGAVTLGAYFLFLLSVAELPPGKVTVFVGDRLPAFVALSDSGTEVSSENWAGRRTLLKFFRGHW